MAEFYDTHAHLDDDVFKPDLTALLARAQAAGITRIISVGTDLNSSRRAVALAEQHALVFAAVGWHPDNAPAAPADIRGELRELARHPKTVAIGECGLDYYRLPGSRGGSAAEDAACQRQQAEIFQQQLEVAAATGLNCVVHQRNSFDDTLAQIQPFAGRVRGVFHCFGESPARLRKILDLGWQVSYTGIVTFKNGQNIRDAVAATPLDQFMLETDSPYLAPVPFRGKHCEPAYVRETALAIAEVKKCSLDELSAATCRTAREFFKKMT